jgi:hypothetical protein
VLPKRLSDPIERLMAVVRELREELPPDTPGENANGA